MRHIGKGIGKAAPPDPPIYPANPQGFVTVLAPIAKAGGRRGRVTAVVAAIAAAGTIVPVAIFGLRTIDSVIDISDGVDPLFNCFVADETNVAGGLGVVAADGQSVTITHGAVGAQPVVIQVEGVF